MVLLPQCFARPGEGDGPPVAERLGARYRENGHNLDALPGKHRKVRMSFEECGRGFMRVRANDHVGAHLIARIFDTALGDLFGLTERSAHANDCGLVFFSPRFPSRYPRFLPNESLCFWKSIPCGHLRVRFAGEKHREKCVVRTHKISFPPRFAGSNKSSM